MLDPDRVLVAVARVAGLIRLDVPRANVEGHDENDSAGLVDQIVRAVTRALVPRERGRAFRTTGAMQDDRLDVRRRHRAALELPRVLVALIVDPDVLEHPARHRGPDALDPARARAHRDRRLAGLLLVRRSLD